MSLCVCVSIAARRVFVSRIFVASVSVSSGFKVLFVYDVVLFDGGGMNL